MSGLGSFNDIWDDSDLYDDFVSSSLGVYSTASIFCAGYQLSTQLGSRCSNEVGIGSVGGQGDGCGQSMGRLVLLRE